MKKLSLISALALILSTGAMAGGKSDTAKGMSDTIKGLGNGSQPASSYNGGWGNIAGPASGTSKNNPSPK